MHPLFVGRVMAIATRHKKELIMADKLQEKLGVRCVVPEQLDTDLLGTFTGEIERSLSPVDAARKKCLMAMSILGCDLAIANEGSFGTHPSIPFCQADEEVILLLDKRHHLELIACELSAETNFDGTTVSSLSQAYKFALRIGFPSHALIMRPKQDARTDIVKDIHTWPYLCEVYTTMMQQFGSVYIETDLRSMHNPTRRKVIARALDKLCKLIDSECPRCAMPGFDFSMVNYGLPCRACGAQTRSVLSIVKKCKSCAYENLVLYPHGEFEEPMYCDQCNP